MNKHNDKNNFNEGHYKSHKHIETAYKPKSSNKLTFFFGPDQYPQHHTQRIHYFSKQNFQLIKTYGFRKTTHNHLKLYHPTLQKLILLFGFPFFMLGIIFMFLIAEICVFFFGIFVIVRDSSYQFGCFWATLLLPASIVIGGLGAAFFPWVFKDYIMQLHYEFWFQFAEDYFEALCSIRN